MRKQWPLRPIRLTRSKAGRTMPWAEVLADFEKWCAKNPKLDPIRRLATDLYRTAGNDVFATSLIGCRLLLSPSEELYFGENVIIIAYDPSKTEFSFEHQSPSNNDDCQVCAENDVWHTLRLFVGYKFGVRLPEERPIDVM